jgi:dTDP-D-glucose 4,6-dehydratase
MTEFNFYFEAALTDENSLKKAEKTLNTDLSLLSKVCTFQYQVEFFEKQASEVDLIFDLKTQFVRVNIQCTLKQLCNYHHLAQMLSGYFGLFVSTDFVYGAYTALH